MFITTFGKGWAKQHFLEKYRKTTFGKGWAKHTFKKGIAKH